MTSGYLLTLFLTIFLVFTGLGAVGATANDKRFDEAKMAWLNGDDESSLPVLAALAREGHARARLLLGRIEVTDRVLSQYREALTSAEARALFRKTEGEGAFGRSWLAVEAERGNELAALLLQSRKPDPDPDLIAKLFAMGEREAADHPIRILSLYGTAAQKQALLQSGPLTQDLRPYVTYLLGTPEPRGDGLAALRHLAPGQVVSKDDPEDLAMAGALALGWGFGTLDPSNRWSALVGDWILRAPSTRPIADLCRAECPMDVETCAMTMMALSGGYYEVIRLDSPLEREISQVEFLTSPRARQTALRRAALTRAETDAELASLPEIAAHSQCLAERIGQIRKAP